MSETQASPRERLKASIADFPTSSGVYIMKDASDKVMYVGKAKHLRNRVRSYFNAGKDVKTSLLVRRVAHIEYIVTRNEYEALLLENNLIKKWKPRYNINLKDGKTYPVIRITNDEWPRVFKTRNMVQDGSAYYGPFASVTHLDRYLELIERLYPLRKCRGPIRPRQHPCLYWHIGRCAAVCAGKTSKEEYERRIDGIKRLLSGETEDIKRDLETRMRGASEELEFERAADYRDILQSIEALESEQQVIDFDPDIRDYVGYAVEGDMATFVVFQMRAGKLIGTDMFSSRVFGSEEENLEQFVLQYYGTKGSVPDKLYIPLALERSRLERYFDDEHDRRVSIAVPQESRDRSIQRMAAENARQDLEKRVRERGNLPALRELEKVLNLSAPPLRIEGFDIAHLDGKYPVASMVSFANGVPDKSQYRKFHVKHLEGNIDDFEAMREVIARRYTRVLNEKLPRPDLILVDGGKGQVSAAVEILDSLGLAEITVIGLAKRNEEIFTRASSDPVVLPEGSAPLRVLQAVRDEAHRFATTFRSRLQQKTLSLETLQSVPGIGEKRGRRIIQAFGSLDAVAETPPDIIAKTVGIPEEKAKEVVRAITGEE
ncbi:MAG: excinuclease ABC subunit UvrC [Spirochaetes bacterium]|jgi:excinuclease ABC subunit C|nr:excinuclease ABC subunit UvrC [Spirochaetota bacterium]